MTQPGWLARLVCFWPLTLLLFLGYGAVVYQWHEGQVGVWPFALTVGLAVGTFRAMLRMRSYRRWEAQWQRMGRMEDAPPPRKRGGVGRLAWWGIAAVLVGVPILLGAHIVRNRIHANELAGGWVIMLACVVAVASVRLARGYFRRRKARGEAKALAASVAWMWGPAKASPSRKAAARQVPDYAMRLMSGKDARPRLCP